MGTTNCQRYHSKELPSCFYLCKLELLEPHPTQRPIDPSHITTLLNEFNECGLLHYEHPGVVIGLGEGWMELKNTGNNNYKITKNDEFLYHLSINNNPSPIAQIIWGSHRTEAIKKYAESERKLEKVYWLYKVLIPCAFIKFF